MVFRDPVVFEPLEEMTGRSFSLFLLALVCPLSLFGGNSVLMLGLDSCSESVLICPSWYHQGHICAHGGLMFVTMVTLWNDIWVFKRNKNPPKHLAWLRSPDACFQATQTRRCFPKQFRTPIPVTRRLAASVRSLRRRESPRPQWNTRVDAHAGCSTSWDSKFGCCHTRFTARPRCLPARLNDAGEHNDLHKQSGDTNWFGQRIALKHIIRTKQCDNNTCVWMMCVDGGWLIVRCAAAGSDTWHVRVVLAGLTLSLDFSGFN